MFFIKLLFFFFLLALAINSNDPFYKAVKGLERINYFIQDIKDCSNQDPSKCCILEISDDCLVKAIEMKKSDFDLTKIVTDREYFIKSSKDMGGKLYARAHIREWQCKSDDDAKNIEGLFKQTEIKDLSPCINKSPFSLFRKSDRIYFIIIGGHYMISELPIIEKQFKNAL